MTVEARELYSSSMGPIVSGSRTPFRANAHRARAERSLWRRIGEDQSGGNGTILQPVTRCAFSPMSELGLVSRALPVHTAMRNCTGDEGGPFEFGNQVLISSYRKLLSSKAMVVNVAETLGHDPSRHG